MLRAARGESSAPESNLGPRSRSYCADSAAPHRCTARSGRSRRVFHAKPGARSRVELGCGRHLIHATRSYFCPLIQSRAALRVWGSERARRSAPVRNNF
jgi:hypothetical protein